MQRTTKPSKLETLIWITAFILANFRGTVLWDVLKQGFQITALPWIEVMIWGLLFVLAVRELIKENLLDEYLLLWSKNWVLILFILIGVLSLLWSVSISATLYRGAALLFSSVIGAYIGTRYSLEGLLNLLFQFGTILLMLCLALALFLPIVGVMGWEPYNGAWRGIFWHKNQFGSLAALFNLVFLVLLLAEVGKQNGRTSLYFIFYLFSLLVIFFSKSVAGYFLAILNAGCALMAFAWLKSRHRLRPVHYYGTLGLGVLAVAILIPNLDIIFGLFNRDTSLTGRLPLWNYLLTEIFARSPWLGYGFGAIWSNSAFRIDVQEVLGWGFPVAIGDNGFLDILLHVGLAGFIPFLAVLIISFVRSGKLAFQRPAIVNFFPLLLLVYAVAANISFSLFIETEAFVWLVIVAVLFVVTKQLVLVSKKAS